MAENNLIEVIKNFNNLNIIVIGDIMLDKYIWGKVHRISPEAPIPIVNVKKTEYRVGGAGNVAANLSGLSCQSTILTITGNDNNAKILKDKVLSHNVTPLFEYDDSRCTTVKSRVVAQEQQLVRIDQEITESISTPKTKKLLTKIARSKTPISAIIISDYNKGLLTHSLIQDVIDKFEDIPIIIDPKVRDYKKYRGATVIKPNYKEFCEAIHKENLPLDQFDHYANKLVTDFNFEGLIVTLGENGVYYYNQGRSHTIPTEAHEVYDVSGAGDTFTAAFTASFVITNDFDVSAKIANLAAAVAIEKLGTAAISAQEIIDKIK